MKIKRFFIWAYKESYLVFCSKIWCQKGFFWAMMQQYYSVRPKLLFQVADSGQKRSDSALYAQICRCGRDFLGKNTVIQRCTPKLVASGGRSWAKTQ